MQSFNYSVILRTRGEIREYHVIRIYHQKAIKYLQHFPNKMHKGHQRHGKGSVCHKFKSIDRDCRKIAETLHCVFSVSNYSNIFNRTSISMLADDDVGYFILKATVQWYCNRRRRVRPIHPWPSESTIIILRLYYECFIVSTRTS